MAAKRLIFHEAFSHNAATRPYSQLLQVGVIEPAKLEALGVTNVGSVCASVA